VIDLWSELRRRYEEQGEKLVLYSCRHAYAHRAHTLCPMLPTKFVAAAMGHSLETHLAAYSRWIGDDEVDAAFSGWSSCRLHDPPGPGPR